MATRPRGLPQRLCSAKASLEHGVGGRPVDKARSRVVVSGRVVPEMSEALQRNYKLAWPEGPEGPSTGGQAPIAEILPDAGVDSCNTAWRCGRSHTMAPMAQVVSLRVQVTV
jgi:hypothetical protein